MPFLLPYTADLARAMIFVDGENLAIRYGAMLKQRNSAPVGRVQYVPGIFVWTAELNLEGLNTPAIMRKYYYTAVQGDQPRLSEVEQRLKDMGIETPRVFKKHRGKGSKRVDITLATDMLVHGMRKHYDVAVLVAGDEDYVPLVRAVQGEGARVGVWFVSDGLSPALRLASDFNCLLDELLFNP
ncbi:MAG: NYN domain-containing protein [Cyanobacteriota bacterium]|nr:NYN domain-containing protein [Cyanobacteriota bacterium]